MVTVPLRAPAALVLSVAAIALLFEAPPGSRLTDPPLLPALPVLAPKLAFNPSVNGPAGAVFLTVSVWLSVSPTCAFVNTTGEGVVAPAAKLKAAEPLPGTMESVWAATLSKLFAMCTACPDSGENTPEVGTVKVTARLPLLAPVATGP